MLKINFSQTLKNIDGKAINEKEPVTIGKTLANALAQLKTDDPIGNYELAKKIYDGGEVELTPEQIVKLKENAKKAEFFDFAMYQILQVLDGKIV